MECRFVVDRMEDNSEDSSWGFDTETDTGLGTEIDTGNLGLNNLGSGVGLSGQQFGSQWAHSDTCQEVLGQPCIDCSFHQSSNLVVEIEGSRKCPPMLYTRGL